MPTATPTSPAPGRTAPALARSTRAARAWRCSGRFACRASAVTEASRTKCLHRENVKSRRIFDENAAARAFIRRPLGQQIKEHGVVRLFIFLLGRVRPIACPHHPVRRSFDVRLRNFARIRIAWRANFLILVRTRQLDPGPALVDQFANDSERGMIRARWMRDAAHVIEYD